MQRFLFFVLFALGAFSHCFDGLFFQVINFIWFVFIGFCLVMFLILLNKECVEEFCRTSKTKKPKINLTKTFILNFILWGITAIAGHVIVAPVMLLLTFVFFYRVSKRLLK